MTVGVGWTMILKVSGKPVQLLAMGVMVMVAVPVTGVKDEISVIPVWSDRPMAVPPEILNTTSAGVPVRDIGVVNTPLQNS